MDRKTDLKNMDAPGVGSGRDANEGMLKTTASMTALESGKNDLTEYTTEAQPKSNLGGKAKH